MSLQQSDSLCLSKITPVSHVEWQAVLVRKRNSMVIIAFAIWLIRGLYEKLGGSRIFSCGQYCLNLLFLSSKTNKWNEHAWLVQDIYVNICVKTEALKLSWWFILTLNSLQTFSKGCMTFHLHRGRSFWLLQSMN